MSIRHSGPFIITAEPGTDVGKHLGIEGISVTQTGLEAPILILCGFKERWPGSLRWETGGIQFYSGDQLFGFNMDDIVQIVCGVSSKRIWAPTSQIEWFPERRIELRVNDVPVYLMYLPHVEGDGYYLQIWIKGSDQRADPIHFEILRCVSVAYDGWFVADENPNYDMGNCSSIQISGAVISHLLMMLYSAGFAVEEIAPGSR